MYEELKGNRSEVKRLQTIVDNIQKTIGQENKRRDIYEISKNGEKLEIKSKRNTRFDENGHIIVQTPSDYWLLNITPKQKIGGTEYTVVQNSWAANLCTKSSQESSRMIKNY